MKHYEVNLKHLTGGTVMKWKSIYINGVIESVRTAGKVSLHVSPVDDDTYAACVCYDKMTFWANYDYKTKKSAKRAAVNTSLRLAKGFYQASL